MPERDHSRSKTSATGKRVGPLQIRYPRKIARDLSSHPHTAERQGSLSGPGILPPDRHRLRRRDHIPATPKTPQPTSGATSKSTRPTPSAEQYEKNLANYRNNTGTLATLKRQLFKIGRKIRSGLFIAVVVFLFGVNIKIKTNSARSISTSAEFVFLL